MGVGKSSQSSGLIQWVEPNWKLNLEFVRAVNQIHEAMVTAANAYIASMRPVFEAIEIQAGDSARHRPGDPEW